MKTSAAACLIEGECLSPHGPPSLLNSWFPCQKEEIKTKWDLGQKLLVQVLQALYYTQCTPTNFAFKNKIYILTLSCIYFTGGHLRFLSHYRADKESPKKKVQNHETLENRAQAKR